MISEDEILSKVEDKRSEIVDLLAEFVKIPSLTGEEGKAQKFVAKYLGDLGLVVDVWEPDIESIFKKYPEAAQYPSHWQHDLILPYHDLPTYDDLINSGKIEVLNYKDRPNVVGRLKGSGGGKSLIINGHIDTVTVEPREKWSVDPFGAQIKDMKMFGRGTTDMKGPLVSAIAAVQCLKELNTTLRGDVILESVVNEEHSGMGALACVERGIMADAAIIIEPTEFNVIISEAGNLYWEVKVKGEPRAPGARWSGFKQVGVSAIEKLPEVIKSLIELETEINKRERPALYKGLPVCSLVIGKVGGGTYDTITAEECSLRGALYFGPGVESVREVMNRMKKAVSQISEKDPWFKQHPVEIFFYHHRNRSEIDPKEPIVETIVRAAEKAVGLKPKAMGALMPADQSFYINQANVPAVIFGPGSMAQAHQIDEYIELDDVINCAKSLALIIYDWCK